MASAEPPHTLAHTDRRERERERESSALLAALFDQLTGASSAEHGSQRERSANPNSYRQIDSTHTACSALHGTLDLALDEREGQTGKTRTAGVFLLVCCSYVCMYDTYRRSYSKQVCMSVVL